MPRTFPNPAPAASPGEPTAEYREFRTEDAAEYHYYQPVRARKSCLVCHQYQELIGDPPAGFDEARHPRQAEEDLMAVVKVVMPDAATRKAINWNRAILLATAIITVFLAMLVAYAIGFFGLALVLTRRRLRA